MHFRTFQILPSISLHPQQLLPSFFLHFVPIHLCYWAVEAHPYRVNRSELSSLSAVAGRSCFGLHPGHYFLFRWHIRIQLIYSYLAQQESWNSDEWLQRYGSEAPNAACSAVRCMHFRSSATAHTATLGVQEVHLL